MAGGGGRRAPFSTDTASHTHTARSLDCPLLTLSSAPTHTNGHTGRASTVLCGTREEPGTLTQGAPVFPGTTPAFDERVSRGQASERAVCVCEAVSVEKGAHAVLRCRPPSFARQEAASAGASP